MGSNEGHMERQKKKYKKLILNLAADDEPCLLCYASLYIIRFSGETFYWRFSLASCVGE